MKNIINSNSIDKHIVKKYNFKILSSQKNQDEDVVEKQSLKTEENEINNVGNGKILKDEEEKEIKDDFISELLKKSDKMSSELIKLQMQIEDGQKEFEARLQKETNVAYEKGKKEGYENAKKDFEKDFNNLKEQYLSSIKKLEDLYNIFNQKIENLKNELTEVSLEIAKEVIEKEISKDSQKIAYSLAVKLLEELKDATKIDIKVNSQDYEYIKNNFSEKTNIEISKDDAISKGGVILFSNIGNLDGDIKTRIEKAKELILKTNT